MTPKKMKWFSYLFIIILIVIAVYPFVDDYFYSEKYTEIAILGPTGEIGKYPKQLQLGQELPLNIFLENHEKQTKLYRVEIKLIENSTLNHNSPPFIADPVLSFLTAIENNKNASHPIKVVIEQPFSGRIVAELYIFDTGASTYIYHDRWVALWMKTTE